MPPTAGGGGEAAWEREVSASSCLLSGTTRLCCPELSGIGVADPTRLLSIIRDRSADLSKTAFDREEPSFNLRPVPLAACPVTPCAL